MKKCINIFLLISLIFSLCVPTSVFAESEIIVISPFVSVEVADEIVYEVNFPDTVDKMYFILDGDKIADFANSSDGVYTITLPTDGLYIGNHIFEAVAVADDGSIISKEHNFTYLKHKETLHVDPSSNSVLPSGFEWIPNNTEDKYYAADGKDETPGNGGALAIKCNAKKKGYDPYIQRVFDPGYLTGVVEISFDVKFSASDMIRLYFECKSSNGGVITIGNNLFKQGKINQGEDILADNWYNVKAYVDLANGENNIYIDDSTVSIHENNIFSKEGANNLRLFRLCAELPPDSSADELEVVIDNFKILQREPLPRIEKLTSVTDSGELEGDIAVGCKSLNMYFTSAYSADIKTDDIVITNGTSEVIPESVSLSSDKNIISVNLNESLAAGSDYTIKLKNSPVYANNNKNYDIAYKFYTSFDGFGIKNVEYKKGVSKLLYKEQLSPGDKFNVEASIVNETNDEKTTTLILGIYSGSKMIKLISMSESIPALTENKVIATAEIEYPDDGDITIEATIIESWSNACNITGPVILK